MEAKEPAHAGGRARTHVPHGRLLPAARRPHNRGLGTRMPGPLGGGSWRSSLLPRRQGALGFGASALPGGRTAGPCAAPPRTPKENETAARWRRPRQGRGREGRAEPHVRRPVLGVPATEDTGVGGETFLPPTPTTQNHKEKPSLHRRESWHPRVQQGAGTAPGHPPPMWAHLLSPSRCEWRLAALRGRLAWRDCGWTPGSPHSRDQATVPGTDTFRASPPAPSPR